LRTFIFFPLLCLLSPPVPRICADREILSLFAGQTSPFFLDLTFRFDLRFLAVLPPPFLAFLPSRPIAFFLPVGSSLLRVLEPASHHSYPPEAPFFTTTSFLVYTPFPRVFFTPLQLSFRPAYPTFPLVFAVRRNLFFLCYSAGHPPVAKTNFPDTLFFFFELSFFPAGACSTFIFSTR